MVNISKESDKDLVELLTKTFYGSRADFNQAFRDLSETPIEKWKEVCGKIYWGLGRLRNSKKFEEFLTEYKKRLAEENITDEQRQEIIYLGQNIVCNQISIILRAKGILIPRVISYLQKPM